MCRARPCLPEDAVVTTAAASAAPTVDPEERADPLLPHLDARREGLSGREAERRLRQFGPNVIERRLVHEAAVGDRALLVAPEAPAAALVERTAFDRTAVPWSSTTANAPWASCL
jgi:hypothetical protein